MLGSMDQAEQLLWRELLVYREPAERAAAPERPARTAGSVLGALGAVPSPPLFAP